jgi:hypothetical protein
VEPKLFIPVPVSTSDKVAVPVPVPDPDPDPRPYLAVFQKKLAVHNLVFLMLAAQKSHFLILFDFFFNFLSFYFISNPDIISGTASIKAKIPVPVFPVPQH